MRKLIILAVALLLVAPAFAGTVTTVGNTDLEISGGLRVRWDYYNNVFDFRDHDDDAGVYSYYYDDDFSYTPWRANVVVKALLTRNVDVVVNIQGVGFFGDNTLAEDGWFYMGPWEGNGPWNGPYSLYGIFPGAGFGSGYLENLLGSRSLHLHEAYIHMRNAWDSAWSFKLGRQQMPLGSGLLVGSDDWYDGLAFDGLRADAEYDMVDLSLFWHKLVNAIGVTSFLGGGWANESDTNFYGVHAGWKTFDKVGFDTALYRLNSNTLGAEYENYVLNARAWSKENMGSLDWSAEFAYQKNTWGTGVAEVDGNGWIFDGRIGWNFNDDMRLGFGLTYQTGDDDWTDSDWDGFWRMFGDSYGRWGNADILYASGIGWWTYDLGSVFDGANGYVIPQLNFRHKVRDNITWGANLVYFLPAEDKFNDGSGEDYTIDWSILEIDAWVAYAYSEHLAITANLSYLDTSWKEGYASSGLVDEDLDNAWRAFVNFKATF